MNLWLKYLSKKGKRKIINKVITEIKNERNTKALAGYTSCQVIVGYRYSQEEDTWKYCMSEVVRYFSNKGYKISLTINDIHNPCSIYEKEAYFELSWD